MPDATKNHVLRTCFGTLLSADRETGVPVHDAEGRVPLVLRRLSERVGVLCRADDGPILIRSATEGAPAGACRVLPCLIAGADDALSIRLADGHLLTAIPDGTVAIDRRSVGGWEEMRAERTGLWVPGFERLDRAPPLHAAPGPETDVAIARVLAATPATVRAVLPVLAARPDYDRLFSAVRMVLADGEARSVWHTRAHLAGGIAAHGWSIGDHTYGAPSIVDGEYGKLSIGRYCSIAGDVRIVVANHATRTATTYPFASLRRYWPSAPGEVADHEGEGVEIGHNVWIGAGATILSGARIGHGAIIGAEAVVAGEVPPYTTVVGNPGRIIRRRFDEGTVARLLATAWWDWPDHKVDRFVPLLLADDVASFLAAAEASAAEMADEAANGATAAARPPRPSTGAELAA